MTGGALFAALPMYDFPEVAWAHDALWRAIARRLAARGIPAPAALTRGGDLDAQWRDPGLLLGQTCGYPYVKALRGAVALVATPEYGFPGCEGATHCSVLVRRTNDPRRALADFRGAGAAINAWESNSGMNLFRAAIAPAAGGAPFFCAVAVTGSHAASLRAIADGEADLAAIDCVSFALILRGAAELRERIAVVGETPRSPCLPYIANGALPRETREAVREALLSSLRDPALAEARAAIGLVGARMAEDEDYERVLALEQEAVAAGYPRLA